MGFTNMFFRSVPCLFIVFTWVFAKEKFFYFDEVRFSNFFLLWIKFLLSNLLLVLDPKEFLLPFPMRFYSCTFYMYVHDKSIVNFGIRCEAVLGSFFLLFCLQIADYFNTICWKTFLFFHYWIAFAILSKINSVQSLSHVRLFATPWITAHQTSLSITNSRSSPRLTSIESVMPSCHLILCRPLLLLPPIPPSIRVFSNESPLRMRWPKYWSFSFSIIPSKEIPGLISFRMDWLDLLAV